MMTYPFENRMAVEGQRYQEALYAREFEEDDHIEFVDADGNVVYEDGYDPYDIVTYCELYECSACPRYGDDCDGKGDE